MPYTIKDDCVICSSCAPTCPREAIKLHDDAEGYWVDPTLCDGCPDVEVPRCVQACDIGSLAPLQPKKGRLKSSLLPAAIPDIFLNGKDAPFASSMVMWEAATVLAQHQTLPWQADPEGYARYCRPVNRGRGELQFRLAANPEMDQPTPVTMSELEIAISNFDIRAACVHLIFAAYALTSDRPWEETFTLNDQHIEQYLGLDKRKDLSKLDKLTLIKNLVHQCCHLLVTIDWPRQGKVKAFELDEQFVWQLLDTQYYFEKGANGDRHLIGLTFTLQAGLWAKFFLNKHDYRHHQAFYQYGSLPQSVLSEVMSNWQQHEGAMRLMLWLLFKLRLGGDHRMTIRTLLRIAYGEERLTEATTVRGAHKRLLKTFEGDLETLYYYGLKPQFDPDTYPTDIQPLWARVADIPDDADDALDFWTKDVHQTQSITDAAPRDKWQRLLNARLIGFDTPDDWQQVRKRQSPNRRRRTGKKSISAQTIQLSGEAVRAARQQCSLTQRALAEQLGKSQSWIRDIEKGRFSLSHTDQTRIREVLNL